MSNNGTGRDGLDRIVIPGYAPSEQPLSSAQRDEQRKALAALVRELAQTSDLHSHAILALKQDVLDAQAQIAALTDQVSGLVFGAEVLSAWVRRPFVQRVRERCAAWWLRLVTR